MASVVSASSGPQIPRRAHPVRCGHLPRSCFPASLSVAPRPHWRGLLQGAGRLEGGGTQALGQPRSSTVTDRGSDSTFQMADRTRRILARASASTAVCVKVHTASSSPPFLPPSPLPVFFPSQTLPPSPSSNSKQSKQLTANMNTWNAWSIFALLPFFPVSFLIFLTHSFPFRRKKTYPAYGYDHPCLSYFRTPTLLSFLLSLFSMSRTGLCGRLLFTCKFGVAPLPTQQKFA